MPKALRSIVILLVNIERDNLVITLPTPHYAKLQACLANTELPLSDRERVEEAVIKYRSWILEMESVTQGSADAVSKLVEMTNRYKNFVELDLIYDSPASFLYRQKGQLKLDNTILEEFLPQLLYRSLRGIGEDFVLGPKKTFAGLTFMSSLAAPGHGGEPLSRTKDQDFILGRPLYIRTAFDKQFTHSKQIESYLGYVCMECKTNLDKTMFQEAIATSRDLKLAVPNSLYFLICEFLDMAPVSVSSTMIDDVLIVRKSKRITANVRQGFKTAESRQKYRVQYAEFLDRSRYYADVFQRLINKIQARIDEADPDPNTVLRQGHF
jgi:hypothetical protein